MHRYRRLCSAEQSGLFMFRLTGILLLFAFACVQVSHAAKVRAPDGVFEQAACITCHEKTQADLVKAWRNSIHARTDKTVDCVACHGNSHKAALPTARKNKICIDCHGGDSGPAVHSYATSKHGVIYRLEETEYDWSRPLANANYRVPGCAYCHLHQANHNVDDSVRAELMDKTAIVGLLQNMRGICQSCHAPRYVTQLFENGESMLEIGRMKWREADQLMQQARTEFSKSELHAAEQQLKKMKLQHLKNVMLGVGHQSADYQWWHGHPALDGDLLRIKGMIGDLRRKTALNAKQQK